MSKLELTLACSAYDRTRPLLDGRVCVDGVDLNYLALPIDETFFRMVRHREFDVSEMSLSTYVMSLFQEQPPFVAIPVFPSRAFRHSFVFVNTAAGIEAPADLRGKRIGLPEYQLTAVAWIRGILSDEYDVPAASVTYYTGGQEAPGRIEKSALDLPPEIVINAIPPDATLSRMLAEGEVDAVYSSRIPSSFSNCDPRVARLFGNPREVEREYFKRTGIFPIMHVIAIRRELYERHRWIAQSFTKAFAAAREIGLADLDEHWALKVGLPWLTAELEETRAAMGRDYWTYGLQPNQHVLETFLRYSHEQGLSPRKLDPEDIFAPETLETYVI